MKTLLSIISLLITTNCFAQLPVWFQETGKPETKVVLQQTYTKDEFVAKYGKLERYSSFYDDEIHYATVQHIEFEYIFIETVDNKVNQFNFGGDHMELRMECWGMTIKIGDNISLYRNLPKDKAYHIESYGNHLTLMVTINGNQADLHLRLYFGEDKKIRAIEWFVPV